MNNINRQHLEQVNSHIKTGMHPTHLKSNIGPRQTILMIILLISSMFWLYHEEIQNFIYGIKINENDDYNEYDDKMIKKEDRDQRRTFNRK